ncbi:MAG: HAMP domain-containing sensor histidine kinase, partial [Pseudomonadota bacterium]
MSSGAKTSFVGSSSVRLAVLLMLVIGLVSAGLVIAVVGAAERTLLAPLSQGVEEDLEFFIWQLQSDELEVFEWYHQELERLFVDTDRIDVDDEQAYVDAYVALLRNTRTASEPSLRAVQMRLWLLGSNTERPLVDRPLAFYQTLMIEESPDDVHEVLFERTQYAADRWPMEWRWPLMSASDRVAALVSAFSNNGKKEEHCLRAVDGSGNSDWQNIGINKGPHVALRLPSQNPLSDRPVLCWTRTLKLETGQTLQFGRIATDTLSAISTLKIWRNIGVVISLVAAVTLGAVLGQSIFARVRNINTLTAKVRQGNLEHRLRLTGTGDDFDQLSANINAMLDKITNLMDGVKQVSDNIAHDLRSPLTRLRNRIEQLQLVDSPTPADIKPIAEQADEVLTTFSSLLRIAQLEQGSQRQSFAKLDLGATLREVIDLYEPVFADAGIHLMFDPPATPVL